MLGKIGDEDPNENETISRLAKYSLCFKSGWSYIDSTKLKVLGEASFSQWGLKLSIFLIYGIPDQKTMHTGPEQQQIRNIR